MDDILKFLGKYNFPLDRNNKTTKDFLEDIFQMYNKDLHLAIHSPDTCIVGEKMCEMIENKIGEIENEASELIDVLRLYDDGRIVAASEKSFEIFDRMKPELMVYFSGAYNKNSYYRIRETGTDKENNLERKELFHIPFSKRFLIGTERYSMPGHPCLYLSSQSELCWYECGCPDDFYIAKFEIPQTEEKNFKFIDFSQAIIPLQYAFVSWFLNAKDDENEKDLIRKYLLKHIYCYPLRAACSVIVKHTQGKFIEEYIIPQLLLQWVVNDNDFDGILYESCSGSEEVRCFGGHNAVLATKHFDDEGYDEKLRESIKLGEPMHVILDEIKKSIMDKNILNDTQNDAEDPFLWNLEDSPSNYEKV